MTATPAQTNLSLFDIEAALHAGVSLHRKSGKYSARIQTGTAYKHLGLFATISEAKVVYDAAAIKYHGEFAYES